MALTNKLTAIANALRSKTGGTGQMTLDEIAAGIQGLNVGTGGGGLALPETIVAGDTPVIGVFTPKSTNNTTLVELGISMTMPRAGTYRFCVPCGFYGSMGGSPTVHIYRNGSDAAQYSLPTNDSTKMTATFDLECAAGDVISLYAISAKSNYFTTTLVVNGLVACIDWDNGF